jgi:hypothetical protein
MSLVKRTTGMGWLAMLACLFVLLVATGVSSSHAQSTLGKSADTLEGGEGGADAGDPDMPTGDTPPPSGSGSPSSSDGNVYRGHAMTGGVTEAVPSKRYGQWAYWKVALKLFARSFIVR